MLDSETKRHVNLGLEPILQPTTDCLGHLLILLQHCQFPTDLEVGVQALGLGAGIPGHPWYHQTDLYCHPSRLGHLVHRAAGELVQVLAPQPCHHHDPCLCSCHGDPQHDTST